MTFNLSTRSNLKSKLLIILSLESNDFLFMYKVKSKKYKEMKMNKKEVDTHRGLQAQNVKKSTTLSRNKAAGSNINSCSLVGHKTGEKKLRNVWQIIPAELPLPFSVEI